ncbi:hypothetical protein SDC9_188918 [bioreactor metagenome]|uniref:Uncharacterized protein n=1 Tax=bioreactor metagenome TaxID=1076179 RepID=A0A645HSB0_9ZZZZ
MHINARVLVADGAGRQVFTAGVHQGAVDLHQVDGFNLGVAAQFAQRAAVAGADHQHFFYLGVHGHRRVDQHLMVDKLILLRQHDHIIQRQHAAELPALKDVDLLVIAGFGIQLGIHHDVQLYIIRVAFRKPK